MADQPWGLEVGVSRRGTPRSSQSLTIDKPTIALRVPYGLRNQLTGELFLPKMVIGHLLAAKGLRRYSAKQLTKGIGRFFKSKGEGATSAVIYGGITVADHDIRDFSSVVMDGLVSKIVS